MAPESMTLQHTCRLLYFGPVESGKRANLRYIHQSLPPEQLLPLDTGDPERQIRFRVNHGENGIWNVMVAAMDSGLDQFPDSAGTGPVPFDGIIFVVDSRLEQLDRSLAAFESLKNYLDTFGLDLTEVPVVIQYNSRDQADILPVDRMESLLNPWGLLSFPANAEKGEGVRETLKSALGLTVNHLKERFEGVTQDSDQQSGLTVNPTSAPEQADGESSGLGIDYGPPIPGSEIQESTKALSDAIFDELSPPVVIPVKIPRRLLSGKGPVKILLEVEIDDNASF